MYFLLYWYLQQAIQWVESNPEIHFYTLDVAFGEFNHRDSCG